VTNLAYCTTEDQLKESFTQSDPSISVKEVRMGRDRATGRSRGFAYVELENKESFDKALNNNGTVLNNFSMKLAPSNPPAKKNQPQPKDQDMEIEQKKEDETEKKKEGVFAIPAKPKRLMPRVVKKTQTMKQKSQEPNKPNL